METLNSLVSSAAVYLLNLKYLILVGAAGSTLSDFTKCMGTGSHITM